MDRRTCFVAALCALATPALAADPLVPDTPVGKAATAYLAVFNQGDASAYAAFLREHWPTSREPAEQYWFTRDQTGGLDIVRVERASDASLGLLVKARANDNYLHFGLEIESGGQGRIRAVALFPVTRPADIAPPARVDDAALMALVEQRLATTPDFSGVLLVARDRRRLLSTTRGDADREGRRPNTVETPFAIASMGKMFTAVAVMQLVQAGKLRLDATVGDYLKDYPNPIFARAVTLHHLLTHTAGSGDFMGPAFDAHQAQLKSLKDYIDLFGGRAPEFTPGARWSYANYGYIVLSRIVEVVAGRAYAAYLDQNIFRPAGMARSGRGRAEAGSVKSYVKGPQGVTAAAFAVGDGEVYSTAPDLLAFAQALTAHKLLDPEHTRLLTTGKVAAERGAKYAYGFFDYSTGAIRDFGHDGGRPGFNGDLRILGDGRMVVVTLSNVGPPPRAMQLSAFIAARARLEA